MPLTEPYPTLSHLMELVGEAGERLAEIGASEGTSGNISLYMGWPVDVRDTFPRQEPITLPTAAPELAGYGFLVTGSGRRMRDIAQDPTANLGYVRVDEGGRTAVLFTAPDRLFEQLTSEFNSHVAVHRDQITRNSLNFHALVHAQPMHLVYLSHIGRYQNSPYLNRHVLRWQPETIYHLPDGIGMLPFLVPGSAELMLGNVRLLRDHRIVLWAKHGVMARSDTSVKRACDLIEYAETGARYEYLNLTNHGLADGLTPSEVRMMCDTLNIEQTIF